MTAVGVAAGVMRQPLDVPGEADLFTGPHVYLWHFAEPWGAGHAARHYTGVAADLEERTLRHLSGRGSRLLLYVVNAGIDITLARVWPCATLKAAYLLERRIKRLGGAARYCPLCRGERALRWGQFSGRFSVSRPRRRARRVSQ
jgi:predicted GIY-YIG superfamily endonuclease